jgi:PAS domain S-box-containing protein
MVNEKSQDKLLFLHEQITEFDKLDIQHKRTRGVTWNKTEEKYRNQLEQIQRSAAVIQDGKIRLVNSRLLKLLGYSAQDLIDSLFMHFVHPDELPKLAKFYGKRLAGEDVPSIYKTVVRHKDESQVHVEISSGIIAFKGNPATLVLVRYLNKKRRPQ